MTEVIGFFLLTWLSYSYLFFNYLPFLVNTVKVNRKGPVPYEFLNRLKVQKTVLLTFKRSFKTTKIALFLIGGPFLIIWSLVSLYYRTKLKSIVAKISEQSEKMDKQVNEVQVNV
jgi:hypothetical protein